MKRHLKYAGYVSRHKWYVFWECFWLALGGQMPWHTRLALVWRGFKHDWTKLLPCEWIPYAWYFNARSHPRFHKNHIPGRFNAAWLHHQHLNDHHWQHWILRNDNGDTQYLRMPQVALLEMICDWRGAGAALGTPDTRGWYCKRHREILLHPASKREVKELLGVHAL